MGKEVTGKSGAVILLVLDVCQCLWSCRKIYDRWGVVVTGGLMSLTSDGAPVIVRLSGGWGGTLSFGVHNPPRESRDMKS